MSARLATGRPAGPAPRAAAPGGLPRLIPPAAVPDPRPAAHLARLGPLPALAPAALIAEVERSGLAGRGGAAFPVHRKLAAVAAGRAGVVAGNGAEGEPGSSKDATLLWLAPHLVLDGLELAARATGATRTLLYVPRDPDLTSHLSRVLSYRQHPAELAGAPDRFLAGEESALVAAISGEPARPRFKRPPVYARGIGGRPTLVHNVETLAHLALIARFGAAWFRAAGTAAEPGTMLVTVQRADGGRHVTEAALGTPLRDLLGGLRPGQAQAVLCGGYHGAWLPAARAAGLTLDNAALRPAGAFAGAGVLAELPASHCGLAETARVARYLALESAGQCGPCFNGLPRIAAALADLAIARPAPRQLADVQRWSGLVAGRGACHHPDGFTRFVASALAVFGPELERHARGRCHATSARPFLPVPAGAATEEDWS
ncbi:MAG TPA: NADH-ubiquinone oxidoreductase-F iron-sulfur binding region domain-containing protein [Streptosporangiaceae bacterium]